MIELITKLADYKFENIISFFCEGIHSAYSKIIEFENNRLVGCHTQRKMMEEYVKYQICEDTDLMGLVCEMNTISTELKKESPDYVTSKYQCYIAARVVHECDSRLAF